MGLSKLFWELFDRAEFKVKIKIIQLIHENGDIEISKDGSVKCLDTHEIDNSFTMSINQVSFSNCDDIQVIFFEILFFF